MGFEQSNSLRCKVQGVKAGNPVSLSTPPTWCLNDILYYGLGLYVIKIVRKAAILDYMPANSASIEAKLRDIVTTFVESLFTFLV